MKMWYYKLVKIFIFGLIGLLILNSCISEEVSTKEKIKVEPYKGPQLEATDLDVVFSDSALTTMKMKAKRQIILHNEDQEYPEGVFVTFYNDKGVVTSTIESKYAYYFEKKDKWRLKGDVLVNNSEKGQKLETQEMFWIPKTQDILVEDKDSVKVTEPDQILQGKGLTAKDDFSTYKVRKVTGIIYVD